MSEELVVPADVVSALADLYWLFPFTKAEDDPRRPGELISRPLPPRPAPRRQIDAAAALLGHPIPDWVVALWCCRVQLGYYDTEEAGTLGRYIVEVDRAAHAGGAPASIVFFAARPGLYPGSQSSKAGPGRRVVTTFVEGSLEHEIFGFEPGAAEGEPPRLVKYHHTATHEQHRIVRVDLISHLQAATRSALECDDTEVYSKELYASILAVRDARRPPFRLVWETKTPAIKPTDLSAPEPESPPSSLRVTHEKFGAGTVLAREGTGAAEKYTIAFSDGTRVVLARFVEPIAPDRT